MEDQDQSLDALVDQAHAKAQAPLEDMVDQVHAAHSGWQGMVKDFREKHPIISGLVMALPDLHEGIMAGAASTPIAAYDMVRKIPGVGDILPAPSEGVRQATVAPDSFMGRAGKVLEQGAEFMLPVGAAVDAVKGGALAAKVGPAAARIAAESAATGGHAFVQSGGDPVAAAVAAGTTGLLGAGGALISGGARAGVNKIMSNAPRPLSQEAQAYAKKIGVIPNAGDLTGSPYVQRGQEILGSTVAPDIAENAIAHNQAALNQAARDMTGDFSVDKFTAGDNTGQSLLQKATDFQNEARGHYGTMAQIEADPAFTKSAQVGTKQVPIQQLRGVQLKGLPTQSAPVMADLGLPVDLRPAKASLQPIKDEISRFMTPTQRRMDPGLSAIENILSRPDAVAASTAEADLGYLKSILRSPGSPQSKRLAGQAVDALSGQIDSAVKGTPAEGILQQARGAWKNKSDIEELVQNLSGDKEASANTALSKGHTLITDRLFRPSDGNFPLLQKVLAATPEARGDLGKAALGDVLKQAEDKPGFYNPASAQNALSRLGKRTKEAIFQPEQLDDVKSFFELSKRINENPNASNTGKMAAMLKLGIFLHNPVAGAAAYGFGRPVAKILYNPEAVTALNTFLKTSNPAEQNAAYSIIKAATAQTGQEVVKP